MQQQRNSVYKMLQTKRAIPNVPTPLWDYIDTPILFNGATALPAVDPNHGARVQFGSPATSSPASVKPLQRTNTSSSISSNASTKPHSSYSHPSAGVRGGNVPTPSALRRLSSELSVKPPLLPLSQPPPPVFNQHPPINVQALKIHLMKEGTLHPKDATAIVQHTKEILALEPNILQLQEPVVVVGDIHGQFYDLVKLLELGGDIGGAADQSYLFLGDYVDRGCFSCECILLLYALKICYPDHVHLLRGNHEGRHLTSYFSFKAECYYKYTPGFYEACIDSFDHLPLAAVVGQQRQYFCVHGGLSPEIMHMEEIMYIHRLREIPTSGAMCDILWSDPHGDVENPVSGSGGTGGASFFSTNSFYDTEPLFTPNEARGCSFVFNFASLSHFIQTNNILCLIRAHEAQDDGYKLYRPHPNTHFPAMLSVFSAPNYCDSYDNKGAVVLLQNGQMNIKQFYSSPHPYVLPNFINGIEWSMPFVVDKTRDTVVQMMRAPTLNTKGGSSNQYAELGSWLDSVLQLTPDEEVEVQEELRRIYELDLDEDEAVFAAKGLDKKKIVLDMTVSPGMVNEESISAIGERVEKIGQLALAIKKTSSSEQDPQHV